MEYPNLLRDYSQLCFQELLLVVLRETIMGCQGLNHVSHMQGICFTFVPAPTMIHFSGKQYFRQQNLVENLLTTKIAIPSRSVYWVKLQVYVYCVYLNHDFILITYSSPKITRYFILYFLSHNVSKLVPINSMCLLTFFMQKQLQGWKYGSRCWCTCFMQEFQVRSKH